MGPRTWNIEQPAARGLGGKIQRVAEHRRMKMRWIPRAVRAAVFLSAGALAQSTDLYPQRAVRIVVPYPPDSGTDIVARLLGQRIGEHWGQPVVVENRPGAGAIVGVGPVARAARDGYTIGIADTGPFAINPALYPKLPYDPVRDFTPVIELAKLPFMLVAHPSLGVSSVTELIAKGPVPAMPIVYPSGAALATVSTPTIAPAPGRFSTTTGWPQCSPIPWPGSRAAMSVPEPGGYGTTIRTARCG